MTYLDRYILRQLLGPFAFFILIFVGLLWLNQALSKIDIVIENGQPARIFLELSAYLLPRVFEIAIPISGFAAAVLVTNRLFSESELVVMMSSGRSITRLGLPYLMFGLLCLTMMLSVVHFFKPLADSKLLDRQEEISREYVTQIVQQGEFISNDERFTFYFGSKGQNGELADILINEQRTPTSTVTHVAQAGQAVVQDGSAKLLLFNGSIQEFDRRTRVLNVIQFSSLSFDLDQFAVDIAPRVKSFDEADTRSLVEEIKTTATTDPLLLDKRAALNARFVKPLLALLAPVLGMSILLVGGFNRSGFLARIIVAVIMMFSIDAFRGITESWFLQGSFGWPVLYLPVLAIGGIILIALRLGSMDLSAMTKRLRKGRAAKVGA